MHDGVAPEGTYDNAGWRQDAKQDDVRLPVIWAPFRRVGFVSVIIASGLFALGLPGLVGP